MDYNGHYPLDLSYDMDSNRLEVKVADDSKPWPRFVKNTVRQLDIQTGTGQHLAIERHGDKVVCELPPMTREFKLYLGKRFIGSIDIAPNNGTLSQGEREPITSTDTRRMGTFHETEPYLLPEDRTLVERAKEAVTTDIHTHSSGQIFAHSLIEVAKAHKAFYPVRLLKEANIDTDFETFPDTPEYRQTISRVPFPPKDTGEEEATEEGIRIDKLSRKQQHLLELRMALPTDRTSTFIEIENDTNKFRYPLSKLPNLYAETIVAMAREYKADGVHLATPSAVGLDNPAMFKAIHEGVDAIEQDPELKDVTLRFLYAIPRGFPLPLIHQHLEKLKTLSASPYIAGLDFVGYEVNKTSEFAAELDNFCAWANDNRPGFTIRVHAGENDKNLDNVKNVLDSAERHPNLRFHIGHGIYGLDPETKQRITQLNADADRPRVILEPNPPSSISLDNVNCLTQIPLGRLIENRIPFVLSSDCSGTYTTTAKQIGIDALSAGMTHEGLQQLQETQDHLTHCFRGYSQELADRIPGWDTAEGRERFVSEMMGTMVGTSKPQTPPPTPEQKLAAKEKARAAEEANREIIRGKLRERTVTLVDPHEKLPELERRTPIGIFGSAGSNWRAMTPEQQHSSAVALDMLVNALSPEEARIVQGRSKPEGINRIINLSRRDVAARGGPRLTNVGLWQQANYDEPDSFKDLSHVEIIPGTKHIDIPDAIVDHVFEHTYDHKGTAIHDGAIIAVGGGTFTSNTITKADQRGIRDDSSPANKRMLVLFEGAGGASADKARFLHPDFRALDGRTVLRKLYQHYEKVRPGVFNEHFRNLVHDRGLEGALTAMEHESQARVERIFPEIRVSGERRTQPDQPNPDEEPALPFGQPLAKITDGTLAATIDPHAHDRSNGK